MFISLHEILSLLAVVLFLVIFGASGRYVTALFGNNPESRISASRLRWKLCLRIVIREDAAHVYYIKLKQIIVS